MKYYYCLYNIFKDVYAYMFYIHIFIYENTLKNLSIINSSSVIRLSVVE